MRAKPNPGAGAGSDDRHQLERWLAQGQSQRCLLLLGWFRAPGRVKPLLPLVATCLDDYWRVSTIADEFLRLHINNFGYWRVSIITVPCFAPLASLYDYWWVFTIIDMHLRLLTHLCDYWGVSMITDLSDYWRVFMIADKSLRLLTCLYEHWRVSLTTDESLWLLIIVTMRPFDYWCVFTIAVVSQWLLTILYRQWRISKVYGASLMIADESLWLPVEFKFKNKSRVHPVNQWLALYYLLPSGPCQRAIRELNTVTHLQCLWLE